MIDAWVVIDTEATRDNQSTNQPTNQSIDERHTHFFFVSISCFAK